MFVILVGSNCSQECLDFFIFRTLLHMPAHLTGKNTDFVQRMLEVGCHLSCCCYPLYQERSLYPMNR